MAVTSQSSAQKTFEPLRDIPDLSSQVCLVTGANSGLGEGTVAALAQHNPKKLYLAARSRAKAEEALKRIRATSEAANNANIEIIDLDLASFKSIRDAADKLNRETERLDLLQLNGGLASPPHSTTEDGYEMQFGTNYLGHALLTQLLMPKLLQTAAIPGADVRIVSVSSHMHKVLAPKAGILFEQLKSSMANNRVTQLYGQSMLAKTLFTYELSKRYPQITSVSLHPGVVRTNVWHRENGINKILYNYVFMPVVGLMSISCEEGVKTQLWSSFSKEVKNGAYYEPVGLGGREGKLTLNDELASSLWDWTDKELLAFNSPGWEKN